MLGLDHLTRLIYTTRTAMASLETLAEFVFQPSGKDVGSKLKKIGPIDEIIATLGTFTTATVGDLTITGTINGSPSGGLVFTNNVQTLSNKSLVDNSTFIIDSIDATRRIGFDAGGTTGTTTTLTFAQTANRTLTFPNATDTLVARTTTDTLSNKSLVDSSTFIVDSVDATKRVNINAGGTTGTTTTLDFIQTANRLLTFPDASDTMVARATTDTLSNKSLVDTTTFVVDAVDSTKRIGFDAAGTTGTTTTMAFAQTTNRVLTFPDATDTVVARATTDTLTNKSLVDASTYVVDGADATKRIGFSAGGTTGTTTTLEFAQTTNRLLTFPDATDTMVGRATVDTLANKSLIDASTAIVDLSDPTRRLVFDVAGTTGTTSTITTTQTASTQYVLPNTAGLTANFIIAETSQTITGMKTFPGVILTPQVANPGGASAAITVWIDASTGHATRGSVDLETAGVTGPLASADNAVARFDGTTGQIIQNSSIIIDDLGGIFTSGPASTLAYTFSNNFIGGGTTLTTLAGTDNLIFGPLAGRFLAGAVVGNTIVGTGAGSLLTGGSNNTLVGNNAGSSYNGGEGDNIIIGINPGVVNESATTRIGNNQTRAFIAGIYGVTPAGPTQYAIIDASGQIGSADLPATTTTATGTLNSAAPVASTAYNLVKVGNAVTLQIAAVTPTVAGSQATIVFNTLPVGYRPAINTEYAVLFTSGGVYDTGLIGAISITTAGVVTFHRDRSGAGLFTGVSGLALGWSVSYIAA